MIQGKNYSYRKEGYKFVLLQDGRPLLTPKHNKVSFDNEKIIRQALLELNSGKADYTSPASLICYLFTYCDLIAEYSLKQVAQDIETYCKGGIADDPYLMIGHSTPMRNEYAEQMAGRITGRLKDCTFSQLVAMIVVLNSYDSIVLPYYIMRALLWNDQARVSIAEDYDAYCKLRNSFLALVEECDREEYGKNFDESEYTVYSRSMSDMIDAFMTFV